MARNRSVFCLRGPFSNRDGIDDLSARLSVFAGMARAAHAPLRPQIVHQIFFQYAPRLNEQAAIDGLVGHAHAFVVGVAGFQPSGNLLWRPVQNQFTRNHVAQLAVHGKKTAFRSQRRVPSLLVRIMSAISGPASMTRDFPAHRGGSSIKATRDLTNRRAGSNPSRNVLSLSECEC